MAMQYTPWIFPIAEIMSTIILWLSVRYISFSFSNECSQTCLVCNPGTRAITDTIDGPCILPINYMLTHFHIGDIV